MMLTAKSEEADIVRGLNLGANDYVTKPFSPQGVAGPRAGGAPPPAGGRGRGRRRRGRTTKSSRSTTWSFTRAARGAGRRQARHLSSTEFRVLHFLASRPGWVFSRQQILDGVHGDNYAITDRAVDVQIVGLRKKLAMPASTSRRSAASAIASRNRFGCAAAALFWQIAFDELLHRACDRDRRGRSTRRQRVGSSARSNVWSKLERRPTPACAATGRRWTPTARRGCRAVPELSDGWACGLTVILPSGKVIADSDEDPGRVGQPPRAAGSCRGPRRRDRPLDPATASRGRKCYMYLAMPLRREGQIVAVVRTSLPQRCCRRRCGRLYAEIAAAGLLAVVWSQRAASWPRGGWSAPSRKSAAAPITCPRRMEVPPARQPLGGNRHVG